MKEIGILKRRANQNKWGALKTILITMVDKNLYANEMNRYSETPPCKKNAQKNEIKREVFLPP